MSKAYLVESTCRCAPCFVVSVFFICLGFLIESMLLKVRYRIALTGLLSCFLNFSTHVAADTLDGFDQELRSFSHSYINDFLFHMRRIKPKVSSLPCGICPFVYRVSILPISFEGSFLYRWMVFNIGCDLKHFPSPYASMRNIEIFKDDGLRGNLVFGNLYRYSPYVRVGYDFIPLGYHIFGVRAGRDLLTRGMLHLKSKIFEMGGHYSNAKHQLQGSTVFCQDYSLVLFSIQYTRKESLEVSRFLTIDSYKIGGGQGVGLSSQIPSQEMPYYGKPFNFYMHIDFLKHYNFRFEYIRNTFFNKTVNIDTGVMSSVSPAAIQLEFFKYFSRIPILRWRSPWSIFAGYEKGVNKDYHAQENFFGGIKCECLNKHITLVCGAWWNCKKSEIEHLGRIGISL